MNPNPPKFVMGSQIRAARALLGWRREDLATAANLHPNAVSYWESASSSHHASNLTPASGCGKPWQARESSPSTAQRRACV